MVSTVDEFFSNGGFQMFKEKNPLLSDEFLDELAKEINQQYGDFKEELTVGPINNEWI